MSGEPQEAFSTLLKQSFVPVLMRPNDALHSRFKELALAAFAIKLKFSESLQQKFEKFVANPADFSVKGPILAAFKAAAGDV